MIRKFKPGDWVKLKGRNISPKMEVLKYIPKKDMLFGTVNNDSYLECVWYKKGKRKLRVFHQNKLMKLMGTGGLFKT